MSPMIRWMAAVATAWGVAAGLSPNASACEVVLQNNGAWLDYSNPNEGSLVDLPPSLSPFAGFQVVGDTCVNSGTTESYSDYRFNLVDFDGISPPKIANVPVYSLTDARTGVSIIFSSIAAAESGPFADLGAFPRFNIPRGQSLPAGNYVEDLTLVSSALYCDRNAVCSRVSLPPKNIQIRVDVPSQFSISAAGGGTRATLEFDDLAITNDKSVNLNVRSSSRFQVSMTSANGGMMKLIGTQLDTDDVKVPYTATFNGRTISPGASPGAAYVDPRAGGTAGATEPMTFEVTIGDIRGKRGGNYQDVVTLTIEAAP